MLLVDDPLGHPKLAQLSDAARSEWLATVGYCSRTGSDIIEARRILGLTDAIAEEWEQAGLAAQAPFGHLRMLTRGWIWDFDPV